MRPVMSAARAILDKLRVCVRAEMTHNRKNVVPVQNAGHPNVGEKGNSRRGKDKDETMKI